MIRIVETTDEEKLKMYLKKTKKELAEMLIECNRLIKLMSENNLLKQGEQK